MLFSLKSRHTLCSYQVVVSTLLTHHQRSFTWQRRKLFLFCLAETKRRLRAPLVSFEFFVQSGTYQTSMIYTICYNVKLAQQRKFCTLSKKGQSTPPQGTLMALPVIHCQRVGVIIFMASIPCDEGSSVNLTGDCFRTLPRGYCIPNDAREISQGQEFCTPRPEGQAQFKFWRLGVPYSCSWDIQRLESI